MNNLHEDKSYIFFDGICNFCHSSVNFIIKHDRKDRFRFASLQSVTASKMLFDHGANCDSMDSIKLIHGGKVYDQSTAALLIAKELNGLYPLLYYCFFWIPSFIRNVPYQIIATYRYKLFGKKETCHMPSESEKLKFV